MNEISKYLKDNPEYYIDGWEEIITNLDTIKNKIELILNVYNNINIKYDKINWVSPCIKIDIDWNEIWYVSYYVRNDKLWIATSRINDWIKIDNFNNKINFQKQWYWKILYISVALEAYKRNKI